MSEEVKDDKNKGGSAPDPRPKTRKPAKYYVATRDGNIINLEGGVKNVGDGVAWIRENGTEGVSYDIVAIHKSGIRIKQKVSRVVSIEG